ncbi:MAG: aminopeptidase P family protein [Geminicoccaceae bacterium]|nr:aminopeptidase P family protein [Geminicoccaceae bacterium]
MSHAERLAAVREMLSRSGVDGFILPRTDRHGSEYLPDCEQRVAWLTGFTGSAATVVITADRAAVFSDGRYTVQLAEEVDGGLFERCHLADDPPREWLGRHLPAGGRLGFDAYLTRKAEFRALEKVLARRGSSLLAIENPVDTVWTDRPAPPTAPAQRLDIRFAGTESRSKRASMGEAIARLGAEAMLVTTADHIAWLLNVRGGDIPYNPLCLSHLLLERDGGCRWFVDPHKTGALGPLDNAVEILPPEALETAIADLSGRRVLIDPTGTHLGYIDALEAAGAVIIEDTDPIALAKAKKNETEIQGAITAQKRDALAMLRFLCWLDTIPLDGSISELDAARRLEEERAKDPLYRGPSFETISAHGPNAALPHYRVTTTSSRPLTGGTVYLVDSGGQYPDGTTDITRTVALGKVNGDIRRTNTMVLKGHIAIARCRFPAGTSGAQLDTLARHPLWQAGLDFDHGTGHGVGAYLCVHEGPQRISKSGPAALEAGMIVSNEPGYYRTGQFGIRIENLVVVAPASKSASDERRMHAFDTITLCPIDRRLIDGDLLDDGERTWLDAYHARVRHELAPLVEDTAIRHWLEAATTPL